MTATSFPPPGWNVEIKPNEPVQHQPVAPTLWHKNLKRLRKEFRAARETLGPLRCKLFQTSTSHSDPQEPPDGFQNGEAFTMGALYHLFKQHLTEDGKPRYRKHATLDVDGKPIVDPQGQALLCDLPATRKWCFVGRLETKAQWNDLAQRAGSALLGSPLAAIAWIPDATFFTQRDANRWLWSLFDLAWQGHHPSLRTERKTWLMKTAKESGAKTDTVFVPYDTVALRKLQEHVPDTFAEIPEAWLEWPPGFFISELPDLFQSSVDLMDTLQDMAAKVEGQMIVPLASVVPTSTSGSAADATNIELTPIHRDLLKLIRTLCYEGLPQTQLAFARPDDPHLPNWKPAPGGSHYVLPQGVPEPVVKACSFRMTIAERQQRWGENAPGMDIALQYLIDRRLLDVTHSDRPFCAAFRNYFNEVEIVSNITLEESQLWHGYMWKIPALVLCLEERATGLVASHRHRVFKLSERAMAWLDATGIGKPPNDDLPLADKTDSGVDVPSPESGQKRRADQKGVGGRPTVGETEARKRRTLVDDWNQAKSADVRQKDFCEEKGVTLEYLTKCINWNAQRRRRKTP